MKPSKASGVNQAFTLVGMRLPQIQIANQERMNHTKPDLDPNLKDNRVEYVENKVLSYCGFKSSGNFAFSTVTILAACKLAFGQKHKTIEEKLLK